MRRAWLYIFLVLLVTGAIGLSCGRAVLVNLGDDRNLTPTPTPPDGRHHPAGWGDPAQHGLAALFVAEDCRTCHGQQLEGAPAGNDIGCDGCHQAGWRTNCTYCHGGYDNDTGAPPEDLTGDKDINNLIFKSHTKHVDTTVVADPFTCVECHGPIPADALTTDHWFDDTHTRAEIDFSNGVSAAGMYNFNDGRCSQMWCHGNGRGDNGAAAYDDGPKTCTSCHSMGNGLGGEHNEHNGEDCFDCHAMTVNLAEDITGPAVHVNRMVEIEFGSSNVTWNSGTRRCDGACHGRNHQNDSW